MLCFKKRLILRTGCYRLKHIYNAFKNLNKQIIFCLDIYSQTALQILQNTRKGRITFFYYLAHFCTSIFPVQNPLAILIRWLHYIGAAGAYLI